MRSKILLVAAAVAATGASVTAADAAPRHRFVRAEPAPLTIYKRSYLEPSNQVPVGSRNDYVVESTIFESPDIARRSYFYELGRDVLPQPFYAPGWTGPQFVFDSGYRVGQGY